jgi:5-methyltetrahydropteroyltriglutamate--homocysteine methyltransferase
MNIKTSVTGFPRIGGNRELKKALEDFWAGKIPENELEKRAKEIRKNNWIYQKENNIDLISCNDFSYYDNMLDTIFMLKAIPERFKSIKNKTEMYFAMARGNESITAMEMTKWFNTNYHYIVPELNKDMVFELDHAKIVAEYNEAKNLGIKPKINIIGPLTFLGLSKDADGKDCYEYIDKIISVYEKLIDCISLLDNEVYLQIEEPILVKNPSEKQLNLLKTVYDNLSKISDNIKIIITTYFEHASEAIPVLANTKIWGIGLDFIYGYKNLESLKELKDKKLIAGVVSGRDIWINDISKTVDLLKNISKEIPEENIIISSSCSLLHVPYSIKFEKDSKIKKWLSFACEKVKEIFAISKVFHGENLSLDDNTFIQNNCIIIKEKTTSEIINDMKVQERIKNIKITERCESFEKRQKIQKSTINIPLLPTTTIGSFPQTEEVRKLRNDLKKSAISVDTYLSGIKKYIDDCIAFQEEIGLDILVHGEPERNDMVEYFGEQLNGFHFTSNGWVQSYGSRCVKPPVIYGDISRLKPMTVYWISYAQSKTMKIMKGMLTGPVTILNWSFVRDDLPRSEVSKQIALAINDEINDLQNSGIKIIQVDEAAFKEGYPIRKENIPGYEEWATANFKLAVSSAKSETQIHTHMCYSDFNDIIKTIEAMDADVITIETARSGNEILDVFKKSGYKQEIGPGVYDIHSPRVPKVSEFEKQIKSIIDAFPVDKIWINPDCGLKTRKWEEVKPALSNMVLAAKKIRNVYKSRRS